MKIHLHKVALLVVLFFINTALTAQEQKPKTDVTKHHEKDVRVNNHTADLINKKADANSLLKHKAHFLNNKKADSLRKDVRVNKHRADSFTKRVDSVSRVKQYRAHFLDKKVDSLYKDVRIKKHWSDSARADKRAFAQRHKRDTSGKRKLLQNLRSKKISTSIPCEPNATVFLENIMHKVNILTTTGDKVTVVTTIHYVGQSTSLSDSTWFSKIKLSLAGNENSIDVKSGDLAGSQTWQYSESKGPQLFDDIFNGVTIFDSLGNAIGRRSNLDQDIILYVPEGVKVDIESKYADVTFENNMKKVKARINNGGLTLMDVDQLLTTGMYASITAGNIKHAELDVTNGKLTAKNIGTLQISSKNSSIVLDKVDLLHIKDSQADRFDIKEAQSITGKKAYGNLRLTALTGSVDITGVNADVSIKRIKPSASSVKIDTQYAELALPVNNLKNYTVHFQGNAGSISTPFEKTYATNVSFKASVGNSNDKPTVFQLNCPNCFVKF